MAAGPDLGLAPRLQVSYRESRNQGFLNTCGGPERTWAYNPGRCEGCWSSAPSPGTSHQAPQNPWAGKEGGLPKSPAVLGTVGAVRDSIISALSVVPWCAGAGSKGAKPHWEVRLPFHRFSKGSCYCSSSSKSGCRCLTVPELLQAPFQP